MKDLQTSDPREQKVAEHMRRALAKVDDSQDKALFETSVEVLFVHQCFFAL